MRGLKQEILNKSLSSMQMTYLNGSETSLENTIIILHRFKLILGLRINLTKCKAVWIGRHRFSDQRICRNLKLIWTN